MCFNFRKRKKASIEPCIPQYDEPFAPQNAEPQAPYAPQNTYAQNAGYSHDFDYNYVLTEFGGDIEEGFREIKSPTETDLKNAVDNLTLHDGEMFTLISNEPINGYTLIGAMTEIGEALPTASVQREAGMKNGKRIEKSYDKSVTAAELLKLLCDFLNGHTPDVSDGSWTLDRDIDFSD